MKFFGQFLVQRGAIDDDKLLAALVRQLDSMPAVGTVVYEGGLLPPADQLRVFERQWLTGAEYRRACVELGLWSARLDEEVKRRLAAARQPLGALLISAGHMTLDAVTQALDAFIAQRPGGKSSEEPLSRREGRAVATATSASADVPSDAGLADRYCAFFDEEMLFAMERLVAGMEEEAQLAKSIAALQRRVLPLAFMSRYAELEISHRLWDGLARALTDLGRAPSLAPEALTLLWCLRGGLVERQPESECLGRRGLQARYDAFFQLLAPTRRAG